MSYGSRYAIDRQGAPDLHEPEPNSLGGRGLFIVASISDRWGVELLDGEKIVWCEMAATPGV